MRTLLRVLLLLFLFLLMVGIYAERANAHRFTTPAATKHQTVIVQDDTRYNALYEGMYRWNQVNKHFNGHGVQFRSAAPGEKPTLIVTDYPACRDPWAGIYVGGYRYANGVPRIILNVCQMNSYSYAYRLTTTTHELGHAIDLGHPPHRSFYLRRSIMYDSIVGNRGTIGPHDYKDYRNRWVR